MIQDFIHHDDRVDTIYLFLRTKNSGPYTYLGPLGYLSHDIDREQPVYFQWQLLEWPVPADVLNAVGLILAPAGGNANAAQLAAPPLPPATLVDEPPPTGKKPGARKTATFQGVKRAFHPDQDARNKKLGLEGELLVLAAEKAMLTAGGRPDLAARVVHVSVVEGDGAGYDIRSYDLNGRVRHLEVKTTRSGSSSAFFISPNEVAFSETHPDSFELVRVYGYDKTTGSGRCYRLDGSVRAFLELELELEPSQYRAALM